MGILYKSSPLKRRCVQVSTNRRMNSRTRDMTRHFPVSFRHSARQAESKVHDRNEYSSICARSVASFHACDLEERERSQPETLSRTRRGYQESRFYACATNEARCSLLRHCAPG